MHPKLLSLSRYQLLGGLVLLSELFTALIVVVMSLYFHGRIISDYLITGAVAALLTSLAVLSLILNFIEEIKQHERLRQQDEEALRDVLDSSIDSVHIVDFHTLRFLYVNDACCALFGYSRAELADMPLAAVEANEDEEEIKQHATNIIERGYDRFETRYRRKDGAIVLADVSVRYDQPRQRFIAISKDITERKQMEEALRDSEAYNKLLFASHRTALVVMDGESGRFLDGNQAAATIFGLNTSQELVGLSLNDLAAPAQMPGESSAVKIEQQINTCLAQGEAIFEWLYQRPGGEVRDALVHLMLFQAANSLLIQFSLHDITEQKAAQQQISFLAHHDALTRLPNRLLFAEQLKLAQARAQRHHHWLALLYIDLDNFKQINDQFGHLVGDRVLQQVAARMQQCVRDSDLLARIGGDEFVLLLDEIVDVQTVEFITHRLLLCVNQPVLAGTESYVVSASIGVSIFPEDSEDSEELMRHSDQAMYRSKQLGRNRISFYRCEGIGKG